MVSVSKLRIYTAMRGQTLDTCMRTRNAPTALYSVAGTAAANLAWDNSADGVSAVQETIR